MTKGKNGISPLKNYTRVSQNSSVFKKSVPFSIETTAGN